MDRKRPADVAIKPDPDAKRVKREGGDHFDMYSLPMGPPAAASTSASVVPKVEHGGDGHDRKPLGPVCRHPSFRASTHLEAIWLTARVRSQAPSFGGASKKDKKRRFFSSGPKVIIVRRGKDDTVRAHFNRTGMFVELDIYRSHDAFWNPIDAEKEVFQRLSKAHMDIEPVEPYGFISRWLKQHGQVLVSMIHSSIGCSVGCPDTANRAFQVPTPYNNQTPPSTPPARWSLTSAASLAAVLTTPWSSSTVWMCKRRDRSQRPRSGRRMREPTLTKL